MTAKQFNDLKVTSTKILKYPLVAQHAIHGEIDLLRARLEKGENVDRPTRAYLDYTPLHWATTFGHHDAAQLLLGHGANIEAKDSFDRTPLMLAVLGHQGASVQWLIDHGANIEASWADPPGTLPRRCIQLAIQYLDFSIVESLLNAGANSMFSVMIWPPTTGKKRTISKGTSVGICEYIVATKSWAGEWKDRMLEVVRRCRPEEFMDWWTAQGQDPGPGRTLLYL